MAIHCNVVACRLRLLIHTHTHTHMRVHMHIRMHTHSHIYTSTSSRSCCSLTPLCNYGYICTFTHHTSFVCAIVFFCYQKHAKFVSCNYFLMFVCMYAHLDLSSNSKSPGAAQRRRLHSLLSVLQHVPTAK